MNDADAVARWHRPVDLAEALAIKDRWRAHVRPIAGCTDLMVERNGATTPVPACLDLSTLPELQQITVDADGVTIGAAVSCTRIAAHPVIGGRLPMLVQSTRCTGSIAIQNRATLGGNIMNGSPAADNPPVLLAYGARITLASVRGSRTLDYNAFHTGYRQTVAQDDELLTAIMLPFPARDALQFHRKVGTRRAQAISKVALAAVISCESGPDADAARITRARFGFASLAPTPLLARALAQAVTGKRRGECAAAVVAALASDLQPIDDIRSSAEYRRRVATNLVFAALDAR
ncbi:MAG: FAD binding domain-containing protein [Proteobacteria bacterium]|nr:FAD binding domain-containing protein [Burkholderiales bacterium]